MSHDCKVSVIDRGERYFYLRYFHQCTGRPVEFGTRCITMEDALKEAARLEQSLRSAARYTPGPDTTTRVAPSPERIPDLSGYPSAKPKPAIPLCECCEQPLPRNRGPSTRYCNEKCRAEHRRKTTERQQSQLRLWAQLRHAAKVIKESEEE